MRYLNFDIGREEGARFKKLKEESRHRMDNEELNNSEFVSLLLDVWEMHLDDRADYPECPDCGSSEYVAIPRMYDASEYACYLCNLRFNP